MSKEPSFPTVGTNSTPYYVPLGKSSPDISRLNQGYFSVQVYGTQAAFTGHLWEGAKRLVVESQVNLHLDEKYEVGAESLESILAYREINKNEATQLGFSPVIIDFVPAVMKRVSISIKYVVDKSNYLAKLANLIDSKDLLSTISLTPGVALAAQTISKLSGKLLDAFMPQEERKAILQFSGDFDLTENGMQEGYYIMLGSHTAPNPLPQTPPKFEVQEGGLLLADGQPVTQLSYVILRVICVEAIRDHLADKSPWRKKLQEAKRLAQDYADSFFTNTDQKTKQYLWENGCLPLLREVQTLLRDDPNFLNTEVELIYRNAFRECQNLIYEKEHIRGDNTEKRFAIEEAADRVFLGIPVDEDIDSRLEIYAEQLSKSRKKFKMGEHGERD